MARMRLARAGAAVEGDDRDVGVEQQLEGEPLLLARGPAGPTPRAPRARAGRTRRRPRRASADCEPDRSTANSFSRERRRGCRCDGVGGERAGGVEAVDHLVARSRSWSSRPAGRRSVRRGAAGARPRSTPRWAALMRSAASFDTIVVGPMLGLAERGADDAVVGHGRVEAVLDEEVLLDAVDLDLQGAVPLPIGDRRRRASRRGWTRSSSIVRSAVRAARPTSSGRVLSPSSSSTTVSGTTTSTSSNVVNARRIGDQHRRVEHESRPLSGGPIGCRSRPCRASEPVGLAVRSAVGSPVDGSRSVNVTPRRWIVDGRARRSNAQRARL